MLGVIGVPSSSGEPSEAHSPVIRGGCTGAVARTITTARTLLGSVGGGGGRRGGAGYASSPITGSILAVGTAIPMDGSGTAERSVHGAVHVVIRLVRPMPVRDRIRRGDSLPAISRRRDHLLMVAKIYRSCMRIYIFHRYKA